MVNTAFALGKLPVWKKSVFGALQAGGIPLTVSNPRRFAFLPLEYAAIAK